MAIYKGSTLLTGGSLNNFTSYTTTQRNALTPSEGDVIFNSTDSVLQLYDGTDWNDIQTAAPSISGNKVHYLVIAGGGGGGTNRGAAGGAGGYRTSWDGVGDGSGDEISGGGNDPEDALTLANGTYTITVGAGASADDREGTARLRGGTGANSVFSTITSNGGGGGGWGGSGKSGSSNTYRSGSNGGSGGGAGGQYSTNGTPGSGTANQGFDGGTVTGGSQIFEGAGGGGAGSAAPNATTSYYYSPYNHLSSTGGDGLESTITGTATYRASGGAGFGREPQDGGGGGGSDSSTSTSRGNNDGVSNTGGGGGNGGLGGSGLVVLRFAGGRSYSTTGGTVTASDADNGDKILIWTGSGTITFS